MYTIKLIDIINFIESNNTVESILLWIIYILSNCMNFTIFIISINVYHWWRGIVGSNSKATSMAAKSVSIIHVLGHA